MSQTTRRWERGATLPFVSILLFLLMGAAALAVDLGWLYLNANRLQKAADSAALAGVSHLATLDLPGAEAEAAIATGLNGFPVGVGRPTTMVVTQKTTNDLEVALTTKVDTFFLRVLGFDEVDVARTATSQYVSPVRLGNPGNCFGVGPEALSADNNPCSDTYNFWAAVSGPMASTFNGDPYSTKCFEFKNPGWSCKTPNPDHKTANKYHSYYYGIEVKETDAQDLEILVYDAAFYPRSMTTETGDAFATGDKDSSTPLAGPVTSYRVFEPDNTPLDPRDNTTPIPTCNWSLNPKANDGKTNTYKNEWRLLCTITGTVEPGIYVLEIETQGDFGGSNQYSVGTRMGVGADPQVFGYDAISIYTNQKSTTARLSLAEIDSVHQGKQLRLRFFDPGEDDSSDAKMTVVMPTGNVPDCTWKATDHTGAVTHQSSGEVTCSIDTTEPDPKNGGYKAKFNGQWVEAIIQIPDDYDCGSDCWWEMEITLNKPHDRTTWEAEVIGNPVRLIPNS